MSDSGWRTRLRWAVVHPQRRALLLRGQVGAPAALPVSDLAGRVWAAEAEETAAPRDRLLGFETVLLHRVDQHDDPDARVRRATMLVAPRGPATPSPGTRWVGRADLEGPAGPGRGDAALAVRILDELDGTGGAGPGTRRPPWADPAWFPACEAWLREALERLGSEATGPVRQVRVWELSSVLRAPTPGGDVYLKATIDSPLWGNEALVTGLLAELFPGAVPVPLAVDPERGWMLLPDLGPELGWEVSPEVREDALRGFAKLQVEAVPLVGRLLAAGLPDRRPDRLAAEAEAWLPALQATGRLPGIDQATWLSGEETAELRAAVPRLRRRCAELAGFAVPSTLVHGDLNQGNIAAGKRGRYWFFDWTDACVAHPLVDLATFLWDDDEPVRTRLVEAYLAEWTRFESPERLRRLWRLAEPLAALHHAISYRSIVTNLEPPVEAHMASSTAYWLRRVITLLRRPAGDHG